MKKVNLCDAMFKEFNMNKQNIFKMKIKIKICFSYTYTNDIIYVLILYNIII